MGGANLSRKTSDAHRMDVWGSAQSMVDQNVACLKTKPRTHGEIFKENAGDETERRARLTARARGGPHMAASGDIS